jgi:hypothetical protein
MRLVRVPLKTMPDARAIPCPICEAPARVVDTADHPEWLFIEACPCGGYRVWTDLVATRRLKAHPPPQRRALQERIQAVVTTDRPAWVDTETGTVRGPLVVFSVTLTRS